MKLNFTRDFVFYTIQGEGLRLGEPSIFMRLSGCNLRCEWRRDDGRTNLCDTPYSSHFPEHDDKSLEEIKIALATAVKLPQEAEKYIREQGERVPAGPCKTIVLTGGEPYLQEEMVELVNYLVEEGYFLTIETNGTIYRKTKAQFISLSPKLSSSCVTESKNYASHETSRFQPEALTEFLKNHDCQLKYVVNVIEDLKEIELQVAELEKLIGRSLKQTVVLMPQGLTAKELDQRLWVEAEALKRGWHFTDRLHIRIWGPKRGV